MRAVALYFSLDKYLNPGWQRMREIKEPMSGGIYGLEADGSVKVELDGKVGWFDAQGRWIRGELRHAVPHLCLWIGGPEPASDSR